MLNFLSKKENMKRMMCISLSCLCAVLAGLSVLKLPSSYAQESVSAPATQQPSATEESGASQQPVSSDFSVLKEIMIKDNVISVKTDKPASYNVFKIATPPRLVIELDNTENGWKKKSVILKKNSYFSKVRSGQFQNEPTKITRVVIELKAPVEYESSAKGEMITLTVKAGAEQTASKPETQTPSTESDSEKTESDETAPFAASPTPPEIVNAENPPPQSSSQKTEQKKEIPPSAPQKEEKPMTPKPVKKTEPVKEPMGTSMDPSSLFGRQLVTLDFYDIDIKDLFKLLGEKAGINIVYGNEVVGTISIQLRDVPFKDAVDTVLALKNLKMIALGRNILQVMSSREFDDYRTKAISLTKVFPINYAKASDVNTQLIAILSTLGGKGKTLVDDRTNSIIVTDTPDGIESTNRLIADLDKPTPQVMIEAKIVQVSLGRSIDLGITWGIAYTDQSGNQMVSIGASKEVATTQNVDAGKVPGSGGKLSGLQSRSPLNPTGGSGLELGGAGFSPATGLGLAFGFVKDVVRLNAQLSALQQKNKSKLLSNPKVATLNNQAAVIKSETNEPYITTEVSFSQGQSVTAQKVNTAKSGISLSVTPTINADGRITMKILPDVTSSQPTTIGVPKTTSQQANTTVIVKDGETFVIGGLISEIESDEKSFIPVLGRIPILGNLFKKTSKSKSRAELLVFVTPRIIPF